MSVDDGIRAFWTWWPTARTRIEDAITGGGFASELVNEIGAHVHALGGLAWELAPGATAEHAFVVSANGDPALRVIAELWRQHGPAPDSTWEYFAARQPRSSTSLKMGGVTFEREELVVAFEVDKRRERIDGTYAHPAFRMVSDDRARMVLFLMLDGIFGEDGVERWLGSIEVTRERLDNTRAWQGLVEAQAELARTATGNRMMLGSGTVDGEPSIVTFNAALKRSDHWLYAMHIAITLAVLAEDEAGLPTHDDLTELNSIEEALTVALGPHAAYFGRDTRPHRRYIHWYAPEDGAARAIIERWAAEYPERAPSIEWIRDPAWQFAKRYQ